MKKFFLVMMMAMCLGLAGAAMTPVAEAAPAKLADFEVFDLRSGEVHRLSGLCADKPLYINLWASWCGPCCYEMPAVDEMYLKYRGQVNFAVISVDSSPAEARAFTGGPGAELALPFMYANDLRELIEAYGVTAIPVSIIAAPGGKIIDRTEGAMQAGQLERFISQAL